MIVDKNTRTVTSTMQGDSVRMGIAEGAEAHIMSVLTDLYKDPEAAIIREYSTNGYDAHVEAGIDRPIEVTTPTQLSPFLKVRDYGCGLSVDDIHSIYSQYGASTKRATNDQVGMLGLGCKSALTYADQFTLTSVKNGTRVVVVVGRDEDGAGTMTVMDTRATDEPEGTEVMIPTKRFNNIERKAAEFFRVWPEGSVLLNGKQPARFEGLRLTDDLYIIDGSQDYIVMGNVAYPTEIDVPVSVMAFVPIGAVTFPPARESLMDTAKTRAAQEAIIAKYTETIDAAIQREMDSCSTASDAIRVMVRWRSRIPGAPQPDKYTYSGLPVPVNYAADITPLTQEEIDAGKDAPTMQRVRFGWRSTSDDIGAVPVADYPETLWIKNFVPKRLNKQHRDKATKFCADNGIATEGLTQLVTDPTSGPTTPFIDPALILDWAVVKKVELEPRTRNGRPPRVRGSFDVYVNGTSHTEGLPGDKIDQSNPVFWVNNNWWGAHRYAEALAALYPKFTLVCLPANRVGKFCRELPAAQLARDGIEAGAKQWVKRMSKKQRRALAQYDAGDGARDTLSQLDRSKVDDPMLRHGIDLAKVNVSKLVAQRADFRRYADTGSLVDEADQWKNPLTAYPLVQHTRAALSNPHVYLYLNAAYADRKSRAV